MLFKLIVMQNHLIIMVTGVFTLMVDQIEKEV